jgi:hypothetical protein
LSCADSTKGVLGFKASNTCLTLLKFTSILGVFSPVGGVTLLAVRDRVSLQNRVTYPVKESARPIFT